MKPLIRSGLIASLIAATTPAYAQETEPENSGEETALDNEQSLINQEEELQAEKPVYDQWNLFLSANINGKIADINCRDDKFLENASYDYAHLAGYYQQYKSELVENGHAEPIALNGGDTIFPGAISRYLLSQARAGSNQLLNIIDEIPYEVYGLGNRELIIPHEELIEFANATENTSIAFQAANLQCQDFSGMEALCDAIGTGPQANPFKVVERNGKKMAVISILDPAIINSLSPAQSQGLNIVDPVEVLPSLINDITANGLADLITVQYHLTGDQILEKSHDLASNINGIDILITDQLFVEKSTQELTTSYISVPQTGTFIINGNSHYNNATTVTILTQADDNNGTEKVHGVRVNRVPTKDTAVHESTLELLKEAGQAFCEDWGQPIDPSTPLAHSFEKVDLQTYILNTMRFSTKSEVALINARTFRNDEQFPLSKTLTRNDIYSTLPFNNHLVRTKIQGKVLKSLYPLMGTTVVATGLEVSGDNLIINGRPIMDDRYYSVATNSFIAEGGDRILDPAVLKDTTPVTVEWHDESPSISDLIVHSIETRQFVGKASGTETLSPINNFPNLHRKFLWFLVGSLNLSYNQVTVDNPMIGGEAAYDQSRLTVNSTDQINLEGRTILRADSRNHGWDNDLLMQYATARIQNDTVDEGFQETKDLIRFRSRYNYLGWRADLGNQWWVPSPLLEGQVQTEFDTPDTRDWHQFETTGIAGLSFMLAPPLDIRIGANTRREVFQPDAETTFGLVAGYQLHRINLFEIINRPIQFESELEYYFNDIGASDIHEIRSANRLYFAVYDRLFFTTSFNAFLYRTSAVDEFGTNTELTIGLNYLWDGAFQRF